MEAFQEKLNKQVNDALDQWWNSMSKDELLDYIKSQPQIDADYLRTMLKNEGIQIQFGTTYNAAEKTASTEI